MARYHINSKGEPGVCRATIACPFGDMTKDHFDSPQAAREHFEQEMSSSFVQASTKRAQRVTEATIRASVEALSNARRPDDFEEWDGDKVTHDVMDNMRTRMIADLARDYEAAGSTTPYEDAAAEVASYGEALSFDQAPDDYDFSRPLNEYPAPTTLDESRRSAAIDDMRRVETGDRADRFMHETELGAHFSSAHVELDGRRVQLTVGDEGFNLQGRDIRPGDVVTFDAETMEPVNVSSWDFSRGNGF